MIGFNIWVIWLFFTAAVWVTYIGIRFWVRVVKRMSVFDDTD